MNRTYSLILKMNGLRLDDVRVRFYEEKDGHIVWEGFGDFGQNDVHRQVSLTFYSLSLMQ